MRRNAERNKKKLEQEAKKREKRDLYLQEEIKMEQEMSTKKKKGAIMHL
jgi:hypothetical protein